MPTHRFVAPKLRASAKRLRREMTDAECKLWFHLRAHRFEGLSFRRQTPVGPYIADFVCHDRRLIIELDGGQHTQEKNTAHDAARTDFLNGLGYRVLRFWNTDVFSNLDAVLEAIMNAVREAPPSRSLRDSTSPSRGEEERT